jgi:hypothetical protein
MSLSQMSTLADSVSVVKLQDEIRQRIGGRVRNLRVHRTDDELVLTGTSGTFYVKQLAQHAALTLEPELRLINEITVGDPD